MCRAACHPFSCRIPALAPRLACCFSMAGAHVQPPPRRVQERNVDALMACALPFHATPQFVRLVQVGHAETARTRAPHVSRCWTAGMLCVCSHAWPHQLDIGGTRPTVTYGRQV